MVSYNFMKGDTVKFLTEKGDDSIFVLPLVLLVDFVRIIF